MRRQARTLEHFYQEKLGGIDRIIASAARKGISPEAVRAACAQIYDLHQHTPFLSTVALGQRLFVTARQISNAQRAERTADRSRSRQQLADALTQLATTRDELSHLRRAAHRSISVLNTRLLALEHRHRPFLQKVLDFLEAIPYYG